MYTHFKEFAKSNISNFDLKDFGNQYFMKPNVMVCALFVLSVAACKSKKAIETPTPPVPIVVNKVPIDPKIAFLEQVEKYKYTPSFFNSKASISALMNGNSLDFDAVIQFRKDSAILIVAKKFGFEAGRALITPDSFFLINRLQQEFDAKPLSAITQRFNLPPRFDLLQDVILGYSLNIGTKPYAVNLKDSLAVLSSQHEGSNADNFLDKKTFYLYSSEVEVPSTEGLVEINYKDFRIHKTHSFSYQRQIDAESKKTGTLEVAINFNEVEFDVPKIIRFDIPKRYKKMD